MTVSIQTVLAPIIAFGLLVVIHELGHFLVARWCGVKVLRFSVGMGKVVYSRRFGADQTEWAISMIPLGGYVKMLDARDEDAGVISAADLPREFTHQSVWKRIAIVAAGPAANFLLAIMMYAALAMHGVPGLSPRLGTVPENTAAYQAGLRGGELVTAVNGESIRAWSDLRWKLIQIATEKGRAQIDFDRTVNTDTAKGTATISLDNIPVSDLEGEFMAPLGIALARPPVVVDKLVVDGPGMLAGLHEGDLITAINNQPVADQQKFIGVIKLFPSKPLQLTVMRNGQELHIGVIPDTVKDQGKLVGQIKVILVNPEVTIISETPLVAIQKAIERTWETSVLQLKMLGKMLIGEVSWRNINGPITIADYAGQTARAGVLYYLNFIAFISISLGVMNLLPIPVLDGGLLLYYSLEVLTGRPVSERFGEIAQRTGIGILMTLMIVALFNDVARYFA